MSVPQGPIIGVLSLVQVMAWRREGDKTLHELMVAHVTRIYASQASFN